MKFWIYGYRIFKKNRILNGILALQIFISILLLNLTIGRYSMQMQSVTMFADLIDYQGIYYMPADIFEYEPVDQDNDMPHNNLSSQADFSTLKKVNCLGSIHMLAFQPDNVDSPIDTIVYADCLIDKLPSFFKPQLWQTVKAQEDGKTIPVIILSNLFKNKVTSSRMLVRGSQWTNTPEYRMVDIKGKSHTGNLYLDFSSSGSGISCLDLFTVYHAAGKDRFRQNLFTAVSGGARDHQIGQFVPPVGGYLFFCCFSGWHYQHDRAEYPAISAHVFRLLYLRLSLAKLRMDNSSISVVYVCRGGRCRTDFLAVYGDKGSAVLHADSAHRL